MLPYLKIILYFYVPVYIALWFLAKPILFRCDKWKILLLSFCTICGLQWSNFSVNNLLRLYVGGSVLLQEYACFVIQTLLTSHWTVFCSQLHQHWLKLQKPKCFSFHFIRYSVIFSLLATAIWVQSEVQTNPNMHCMGGLLWETFPIIACIWFVAGNYIVRSFPVVIISISLPTFFYCTMDSIAIQSGIWNVNAESTMKIFSNGLPLEQIIYYSVFNAIIVFASSACDKANVVINMFFPREQFEYATSCGFTVKLFKNSKLWWRSLWVNEIHLSSDVVSDFKTCLNVCYRRTEQYFGSIYLCKNGD